MDSDNKDVEGYNTEHPPQSDQQHERGDRQSQGARVSIDDAPPTNGGSGIDAGPPTAAQVNPFAEPVQSVVTSEVSV